MSIKRFLISAIVSVGLAAVASAALAQKKYDLGASDTEIKIGNIMPYSGPASAYSTIGKVEAAYFKKVNDDGGVNGRKINFISVDDSYSPPKAVEMTRRLVEQDEVLLIFGALGSPSATATRVYMNGKKVPQLFVAAGSSKFNDPKNFPWTMGWQPAFHDEALVYAKYILQAKPDARIAVLYANDEVGKDFVKGLEDGLGEKANLIVAKATYETTDPTVDSQIIQLKASGADVFFNVATPKFASMAIRRTHEIGWNPLQFLMGASNSIGSVLTPAGLDKSAGIISFDFMKQPSDPQWVNDIGMNEWRAFMSKYYPEGDLKDVNNIYGYAKAQTMIQVLKQCGDNLTRENVMKQAADIKNLRLDVLLPGVKISTGPNDYAPNKTYQLVRFDGARWVSFGDTISSR